MAFRQSYSHRSEAGNVFFALFGTIVLLGALGATVSTFIKGPLSSSVQITRANGAETQMAVITQLITMQAASAPNCDADSVVEPIIWRLASGTEPRPINGGLVPTTLGVASTKDPWGTEFGYCVWDHGANSCGSAQRLAGTAVNPDAQTVVAIISAGPDKKFTTTCRTSAAAALANLPLAAKAASTDDDIIYTYSYAEAAGASGGLWAIKSSDANTATIGKNLEVGGGAIFSGAGMFSEIKTDSISARSKDFIAAEDGLRVPDASVYNYTCTLALSGVMRRKGEQLEICVNSTWTEISGTANSAPVAETDDMAVCNAGSLGRVRYNSTTLIIEFCSNSGWIGLVTQGGVGALSVSPTRADDVTVTGPCFLSACPYALGQNQYFIVTNTSSATTAPLDVDFSSTNGGQLYVAGCKGDPLAPGETCMISVMPAANGNAVFDSVIRVYVGSVNTLNIPIRVTGTGFNCAPGMRGWGGVVVSCANSTTPAYVINESGCDGNVTLEPECLGEDDDDDSLRMANHFGVRNPNLLNHASGGQNAANSAGYGYTPAFGYCSNLVKGGYDDWYLPSAVEWTSLIDLMGAGISYSYDYWTSTVAGYWYYGGAMFSYRPALDTLSNSYDTNNLPRVRCLRQHGAAPFVAQKDMTPGLINVDYNFWAMVGLDLGVRFSSTASEAMESNTFLINGINTPVPIYIVGTAAPNFRVTINGGPQVTGGTVKNGDMIKLYGVGPNVTGTQVSTALHVGTEVYTWSIYYSAAATRRIFVTNNTFAGNLGGVIGATTTCQTQGNAAFGGNWYALLADSMAHTKNLIPWNWDRLENLGGELVASNVEDLFDGTLQNPVRYNASGAIVTGRAIWSGLRKEAAFGYQIISSSYNNCNDWTTNSSANYSTMGNAGSKSFGAFHEWGTTCNQLRSLYCIGPF